MNKTHTLSRLFASGAFALLSACGGGGGGGSPSPGPAPAPAPAPTPAPAPSLKQRVMLFIVPSGSATSTYLPNYDTTITSYRQFLYRVVPELNQVELLDNTAGTSYSQWHINALSSDDRLFVRHDWGQFEVSGYHDIKEYTPDAQFARPVQPPVREFRVRRPAADGCSATVGDWYYYRSARNYDILRGDVGGDFYRYNTLTGQEQLLQPVGSAQNCYFHLMASNGALYDVDMKTDATSFTLYRRDLTTGTVSQVQTFTEANAAAYDTTYRFAFDAGVFHIARRRKADGLIEIYRYDLNQATPTVQLLYADVPAVMDILVALDVDDGHLMLASYNGKILLLDLARTTQQVVDIGAKVGSIAQVVVR
jgi:hypothetical protein